MDVGTYSTCGFCHAMVDVDVDTCPTCKHEAHVPRMECRCGQPGCRDAAGNPVAIPATPREVEQVGEHVFEAGPYPFQFCLSCGCHLDDAMTKICSR